MVINICPSCGGTFGYCTDCIDNIISTNIDDDIDVNININDNSDINKVSCSDSCVYCSLISQVICKKVVGYMKFGFSC